MIICDKFVFLHLHKSGGTFVGHMMMKCLPSARRVGYHLPYDQLPPALRHLPVVGTVRNPWAYYVSWYHFQAAQPKPNSLYLICSENGTLDFAGTVRNLVMLTEDADRVERLAATFPEQFVNHGLNLTRACIGRIVGSGVGFYTFLYQRLYAQAQTPTILTTEGLRDQLFKLDVGLRGPERMLMQEFLQSMPDLNVSQHGPYRDYYSPELQALVARMEAPVIENHGYSF